MYKTIVCAIEASKEGKEVLQKAAELAGKYDSKLVAIHVLPYKFLPKDYQKELKESTLPKMEKIFSELNIPKKNRAVKVGKPYEVICHEAKKRKADLIILGTHSKKGVNSLLGSTATGVANHAECDVSLIRI